jgi:two-component system chemotaxis response regulator CheB
VEALVRIARALPAGFPAAVCVVLHIPATGRSLLAPILDRSSDLHAVLAEDGAPLLAGHIYVAPADHHLLVTDTRLALGRGPKENGVRPAVDVLFRSAAESWGPHVIAVVASGALDDGSSGAASVTAAGGTVIVQDPADAVVPSMPERAIAADTPQHVVPLEEIPALLTRLVAQASEPQAVPVPPGDEPADPAVRAERPSGPASGFTCPECSGPLWEVAEGELVRYRCRVGHVYSESALIDGQASSVEAALWAALEVLEERSELLLRVAGRFDAFKPRSAQGFRSAAADSAARAALIRQALGSGAPDRRGSAAG